MRGQVALVLGLLGVLGAGCDEDGLSGYGIENRRNHPLKITARRARSCGGLLDLSRRDSFGAAVTKTLDPGDLVALSTFWYVGDTDPLDDAGVEDAGVDDAGLDDGGVEDAGVGDAGFGVRPSSYPYGCGALWISLPDHDYEALLTWDQSSPYWYFSGDTWKYAVVVEGTKDDVAVHVPSGMRELDPPE